MAGRDITSVKTFGGKRRKVHKTSKADRTFTVCNAIFLIIFSIVTIYPVLNTIAYSFNDGVDAIKGGIHLLPRSFSTKSYSVVFHKEGIITGAKVTVMRTVLGTVLALFFNALLSFIVSRKRFIFKNQLSLFWVITMYVNGGLIPNLLLMQTLGLTGTFWVYVIPGMISAFNMLVMRTYMNGLPDALEEAAMIDGATYWTIFVKVVSPLCKPVYATVALFVAVYQWNSWFDTMLYNMMKPENTTLMYELQKLLATVSNQAGGSASSHAEAGAKGSAVTSVTVRSAATVVTMAPIVCLYPFLQRYFVTGVMIGGVKE
ncbi:putative aldouronate transport system permease protein [Eubacterium uniforme]|uniref:Putative aldouronate transport system permease protein n=1 Tax=Eubacterium uniforme TaxID=39495 RepID=A0A1T4VXN4_9FIRM|nr:carbohydrate ABC transporter permease [Eubacterium uniforme]SKA69568.1 putative aldouronate transport system permease protein [Eubacterium uniforme]